MLTTAGAKRIKQRKSGVFKMSKVAAKVVPYSELSEDAKLSAYEDWLSLQDIIWEEEEIKGDDSREFFESEYANDCKYHLSGAFYLNG